MSSHRRVLLTCALALMLPLPGMAQQGSGTSTTNVRSAAEKRDGRHDFDFAIGTWKTQLKRLV